MQVKQRLQLNVALSVLAATAILVVLVFATYRVSRAVEASDIAGQIVTSAFERLTFRNDYVQSGSERAKVQWFAKHEQIGQLLKTAAEKFRNPVDAKIVSEMIEDQDSIGRIFSGIVKSKTTAKDPAKASELSNETEERLLTQHNMKIYDLILRARGLQESSREAFFSSLRLAMWGIICVLILVFAVVIINSWTMSRSITMRLLLLGEGTSTIGNGNLDHRIDIKGHDEIAELSTAFNAMTGKLSDTYHELRQEITERKEAQEALRDSEERFRLMGDTIPYGAWMADAEGRNIYISPLFLELVGMTFEQVKEFGWTGKMPLEDVEPMMRRWMECVRTGEDWEGELRFPSPDGRCHTILSRGKPVHDAQGRIKVWVGINLDITERKQAEVNLRKSEEALRLANEQLEQRVRERTMDLQQLTEQLEKSRGDLRKLASELVMAEERERKRIAGVLHDEIAQTLAAVRMRLDLLRHVPSDQKDMTLQEAKELLLESIQETRALMNDLGNPLLFDLGLQAACEALAKRLMERSPTRISCDIREPYKNLDPDMKMIMYQIVRELLNNIVKHSKALNAHVQIDSENEHYRVKITDNGVGFEPEALGAPTAEGGFGLYSLRERLIAVDGNLVIESSPGAGTVVTATLPSALD